MTMPNYRRPRRSRNASDPDFNRASGRHEAGDDRGARREERFNDFDADELDADELDLDEFDLDEFGEFAALQKGGLDWARVRAELGDEFEIVDFEHDVDLDELDDELDEADLDALLAQRSWGRVSLDELLQELMNADTLPPLGHLYSLSDLTQSDADKVRRGWELITPERRRALVDQLVTVAEEDLNLQLGSFLRIAMVDQDAVVRSTAVRGLWEDGQADLVGPLVQMLRNDPDVEARAAAATALGSYVLAGELEELEAALAMRAEEALLAVLHDELEPLAVRRRALESIAYSGEVGVRQLIEDAYYSPHEEMRISALFAMGRSADVRWRPLVRAELQSPSPAVRAEAALACGELEAQAALDDLLALLQDPQSEVRLAAIFALGRIGGRDARDALDTVILAGVPEEVEAAEQALEEMQFYADHGTIPLFDETLDDEDEWDNDPGDGWTDWDDRDLGEYE